MTPQPVFWQCSHRKRSNNISPSVMDAVAAVVELTDTEVAATVEQSDLADICDDNGTDILLLSTVSGVANSNVNHMIKLSSNGHGSHIHDKSNDNNRQSLRNISQQLQHQQQHQHQQQLQQQEQQQQPQRSDYVPISLRNKRRKIQGTETNTATISSFSSSSLTAFSQQCNDCFEYYMNLNGQQQQQFVDDSICRSIVRIQQEYDEGLYVYNEPMVMPNNIGDSSFDSTTSFYMMNPTWSDSNVVNTTGSIGSSCANTNHGKAIIALYYNVALSHMQRGQYEDAQCWFYRVLAVVHPSTTNVADNNSTSNNYYNIDPIISTLQRTPQQPINSNSINNMMMQALTIPKSRTVPTTPTTALAVSTTSLMRGGGDPILTRVHHNLGYCYLRQQQRLQEKHEQQQQLNNTNNNNSPDNASNILTKIREDNSAYYHYKQSLIYASNITEAAAAQNAMAVVLYHRYRSFDTSDTSANVANSTTNTTNGHEQNSTTTATIASTSEKNRLKFESDASALVLFQAALAGYQRYNTDSMYSCSSSSTWDEIHGSMVPRYQPGALATVWNNLGRWYFRHHKYNRALAAFELALALRRQISDANMCSNNNTKQFCQPISAPTSLSTTMLKIDNITVPAIDPRDIAASLCNVGQTFHKLGRLDEAVRYYQDFLVLARGCLGERHRDCVVVCKRLAEIRHAQGDLNTAKILYLKALSNCITSETMKPCTDEDSCMRKNKNDDLATAAGILNKLGNLHYELDDLDGALQYYLRGLAIEQEVLPPTHAHTLVTLLNIAQIYRQQGAHAEALRTYGEIHARQLSAHGPQSLPVASTLASMGQLQYQLQNYDPAFQLFQEALQIQRVCYGTDEHVDIAGTLSSIGLVLFNQRMLEMAQACFADSLRIRKQLLGPNHRDISILYYNLATIALEMGDDDSAIRMYRETLRIERMQDVGSARQDAVLTLQHLGIVHQRRGELDAALSYFKEALQLERMRPGGPVGGCPTTTGRLLNIIGNIYLQTGHVTEMMECYSEASRVYTQSSTSTGVCGIVGIAGFNLYLLSKLHPPCAPAA